MSDQDHVVVTRDGAVQSLRLNRPDKRNAITRAMYRAMTDALRAGEADRKVRAHLVLGAAGVFSAGNDIADFVASAAGAALGEEVIAFLKCLAGLEKPIVSGVDGLAVGIGTTLHLHCDLTLASPRSVFRTPFVDLGLVPEGGSSLLAPALMGQQRAFAMLALGADLSAEAALEAGLVWRLVSEDMLAAEARDVARRLADKPPEALLAAKRLLRGGRQAVVDRIDEEAAQFAERLKSREAQAAFARFLAR